jgi:hypothetical protein
VVNAAPANGRTDVRTKYLIYLLSNGQPIVFLSAVRSGRTEPLVLFQQQKKATAESYSRRRQNLKESQAIGFTINVNNTRTKLTFFRSM